MTSTEYTRKAFTAVSSMLFDADAIEPTNEGPPLFVALAPPLVIEWIPLHGTNGPQPSWLTICPLTGSSNSM
jgi:hypothetical protein